MTYEKDNTDSSEEVENSSADEDADIYSNENCADTTDHVVNLQSTETTTVNTTLNHRFWTEAGWKSAGTLEAGDKLTLADGNTATVTNVAYEDTHATVYNFEVEDFHTYYVGTESVLVHNNGGNCMKTASALAQGGSKGGTSSELKVIGTYDNNNYFTRAVEFNAGSEGTGFPYKVYQRNDIDWNIVRTTGAKKGRGLTNAQAAEKYGLAPILNDGYVATLHHSQQRSVGPLFEASTRYHNISNAKKGPLHPYKGQLNPFNPMDSNTRGLFQKVDSIEYWKVRGRDAMKGVQ